MVVTFHILPIAGELRRIREQRGATQGTVAAKAGFNATYLSKIEREQVDPRISTVQDIARALDYEILVVPRDLVPTIRSLMTPADEPSTPSLISIEPD